MASKIAMERLVVIDGSGILGPQLDLVEVELGGSEVTLGGVGQIGMDGKAIEVPRLVRKFFDTGELAGAVVGVAVRVGEIVLRRREVEPERILRRFQFFGCQEPLHEGEPPVTYFLEHGVRHPHGFAL